MRPRTRRWLAAGIALSAVAAVPAATTVSPAAADVPAAELIAERGAAGALVPIEEHVPSAADRYSLAGGCFALHAPAVDGYVARDGDAFATTAEAADAQPFGFRAFDLGKYLLFTDADGVRASGFLAAEGGPAETFDETTREHVDRLPVRPGTDLPRSLYDDAPDVEEPTAAPPSTRTGAVVADADPSARAEWLVREAGTGDGFTLHLPVDDRDVAEPGPSDLDGGAPVAGTLTVTADGALAVVAGEETGETAVFDLVEVTDDETCATYPDIGVDVDGSAPPAGNPVDETRGYIDAHLHMMAFEFIGGRSRCGRPWHPYGPAYALVDCPDHEPGGAGAALEFALSGAPTHDTAGWPTFPYWPKHDSLTHEQVHYRWLERAWRGGLRTFTNLLVDNNALCEAWIYKDNSCNEMDGVRLQAERLRELERFVDAQWGGPGEGWFRIVTDPFEARRTINEGRLAVVMGIEVSVLFDCGLVAGQPQCDADDIDAELEAVHDLGVRQMEFVNKFDNALSGVTGDAGATGPVVNTGNFADTGQFWQMKTCDEPEGHEHHQHDKTQPNVNDSSGGVTGPFLERDGIFGAVLQLSGTSGVAPLYPEGPHCNVRGLTDLGRHLLSRMVEHGMLFDPDHMSSLGRQQALDHLQARGYSGVISSHSWADDTVYERVLQMGGMVTPYAGDAAGFIDTWRATRGWADPRYYFGIGYGADTNGFGSQGGPRNPPDGEGVDYPFDGFGGVSVAQQVSGERTYDIDTDGVAHYGLYPDWIEDIRVQLGEEAGAVFLDEMQRGPEAYLQMWERALGIANDACRDPRVAPPTRADVLALEPGTPAEQVLLALGQPHQRLDGTYRYCTAEGGATITFDAAGEVVTAVPADTGGGGEDAGFVTSHGAVTQELAVTPVGGVAAAVDDHATHVHAGEVAMRPAGAMPRTGSGAVPGALLALGLTGLAAAVLRRSH